MGSRATASADLEDCETQKISDHRANGEHPATDTKSNGSQSALEVLLESELMWQPYRAMSRVLLQTHLNLAAHMAVNRNLAREMQAILMRAQDMALRMSERAIVRMSMTSGQPISTNEIEEMYDFAADGIRELGEATVAAQIRSIEMLRGHAREAVERSNALKGTLRKT